MIDDLDREMRFAMSQLDLIEARLEYIFAAVSYIGSESPVPCMRTNHGGSSHTKTRDVISLRASFSIERMTAQSLTEARAVRIIALITLIFLPPTLTTVRPARMSLPRSCVESSVAQEWSLKYVSS